MTLVLLSGDLMVVSRVEAAARQLGSTLKVVSTGSDALECASANEVHTVIIDLSAPSVDAAAVVAQLKSNQKTPAKIIAFGPHVHEQRLAAAREAGCDLVVSRGQFFAQLESIVSEQHEPH